MMMTLGREPSICGVILFDPSPEGADRAEMLRANAVVVHHVVTADDALYQLKAQCRIALLMLGSSEAWTQRRPLIDRVRGEHPDIEIVAVTGASVGVGDSAEIDIVLEIDWTSADFDTDVLRRVRSCVSCNISLPFRRPLRRERGENWACAFCGEHYFAVIADDATPMELDNAIRPSRR